MNIQKRCEYLTNGSLKNLSKLLKKQQKSLMNLYLDFQLF